MTSADTNPTGRFTKCLNPDIQRRRRRSAREDHERDTNVTSLRNEPGHCARVARLSSGVMSAFDPP